MTGVKITFQDLETQKEIVMTITDQNDGSSDVSFDFGEEGASSHEGPHVGMINMLCESLGIM